jgi:Uri superfamily endonuclease
MNKTASEHAATSFQPDPGTYALLISSATDQLIRIGRLGNLRLQRGFYVYVGSALGPGGVRGRLGHHMRPAERPHWHIDYLRKKTTLEAVWFCYNRKPREHTWVKRFAAMPGASVPLAGFGSSDCDCESHLFFFAKCPRPPARIGAISLKLKRAVQFLPAHASARSTAASL